MASTEYAPGTVAEIRWTMTNGAERAIYNGESWMTESGIDIHAERIADVRPLVVLDLELGCVDTQIPALLAHLRAGMWNCTADQIEAQTKPPRIPEPGLWGVVEASMHAGTTRFTWVRTPEFWYTAKWDSARSWSDLIDPTLIREGVES